MSRKTHEESQQTRKAILDSAYRLFSRRGFERTSLSDIAKYAGVTRGAVYWHFEDKAQLLLELCEDINHAEQLSEKMIRAADPAEPDPLGRIREWLLMCGDEESIRFYCSTVFGVFDRVRTGMSGKKGDQEKIGEVIAAKRAELGNALVNARAKGQLPKDADLEMHIDCITMFLCGFIDVVRMGNESAVIRHYKVLVDRVIADLAGKSV